MADNVGTGELGHVGPRLHIIVYRNLDEKGRERLRKLKEIVDRHVAETEEARRLGQLPVLSPRLGGPENRG